MNWTVSQRILVAVAFLLALRLLSLIPVLGWLALAVAGGVALGSVAKAVWYKGA